MLERSERNLARRLEEEGKKREGKGMSLLRRFGDLTFGVGNIVNSISIFECFDYTPNDYLRAGWDGVDCHELVGTFGRSLIGHDWISDNGF